MNAVLTTLLLWLASAHAASVEDVEARLAEIAPLRERRITKGAPEIHPSEVRRAASGNVVTGGMGQGRAYGSALVQIPIGLLWAGLNDETRHPGFTAVEYSELLKGSVCRSGRRVLQYLPVPVPFVSDRWWIGVLTQNQALQRDTGGSVRELSWRSSVDPSEVTSPSGQKIISKATAIGSTAGGWFLVAIDERSTWLEYYVRSDPGPGVPPSVQSMLVTKGVRQNIDAMSKFARQGRPSCPIQ